MKNKVLTKKDILHLAELAKLTLSDAEVKKYLAQLEETLEYVKNLNELKVKGIVPTSQTTNLKDVFFVDGEKNERRLTQDEATKNAKNKKNGYLIVKRIM